MGRPPSNGGPSFRFNAAEVVEMETILQDHNNMMPAQEVLVSIADKFSNSPERQGKFVVQTKQIWNWFQNKRYAIRARTSKIPTKLNVSSMQSVSTGVPMQPAPVISTMPVAQAKTVVPAAPPAPVISREDSLSPSRLPPHSVADAPGRTSADNSQLEFEARSARDGAWYDVASFMSLRNLEAGCPEVLVRFAGFGPEEDEWIHVMTHVRHRSLPCESSECVAVLPGDLILCFQEGKEQALYFDAHVLDAQRRRHDARGCRCRFLVRYDHDQSEEIVPLRKICRRPETDYRLQQLHAMNDSSAEQRKSASSADHMKPTLAKEQHIIVSSVEQVKTNVDSSSSKAGLSHYAPSDQKPSTPIPLVKTSSVSEEQNSAAVPSTDKASRDINAASNIAELSHPEVINLDPETEVDNNDHEVKDAVEAMVLDEPHEEGTNKTCLPTEKMDDTPMSGINDIVTQNMTVELINQAPPAVEAEHAPKAEHADPEPMIVETESTIDEGNTTSMGSGQVDPEPMLVEMSMTADEGKVKVDQAKDELISSADTYRTQEAITSHSGLPTVAGVDEGKVDVLEGNVTLTENFRETSEAATTDEEKINVDSCNNTLSGTRDDADHHVDNSVPTNSSTANANAEICVEKNDDPI